MVRAAAKNYKDVVVICNPNQYKYLINEINTNNGSTSLNFRENLAEEAFMETAYYESKIFEYFNKKNKNFFPLKNIFSGKLIKKQGMEKIHIKKLQYMLKIIIQILFKLVAKN